MAITDRIFKSPREREFKTPRPKIPMPLFSMHFENFFKTKTNENMLQNSPHRYQYHDLTTTLFENNPAFFALTPWASGTAAGEKKKKKH